MSETEIVWSASAHTLAKHKILKEYLQAWLPILSRYAKPPQQVLFIDGFAGPGEYKGGELGSPIIALETALGHARSFPTPIWFLFIEQDPDRHAHLNGVLDRLRPKIAVTPHIRLLDPLQDDCNTRLSALLDEKEASGIRFGPALVFLDQFGYSAVP